jgi:hypothetical protein
MLRRLVAAKKGKIWTWMADGGRKRQNQSCVGWVDCMEVPSGRVIVMECVAGCWLKAGAETERKWPAVDGLAKAL